MDLMQNIALGLSAALLPHNLLYCFIGVFLGTLTGVLPGIGSLTAMTLLLPLTFRIDPTSAVIMLAGIWYGSGYGGRTASILLNLPGSMANAVTCLDGYPMTKQGRGGVALFMTTLASFGGGTIGILALMLLSPVLARYALDFSSADYFALMFLGLVAASTISEGSTVKSLAMVALGMIFGCVGTDVYTGSYRLDFGSIRLADGISLVAVAMGLFGVAEIISSIRAAETTKIDVKFNTSFAAMVPTRDDVRRSWFPTARGSLIGSFFGSLPGTGAAISSFIAYAIEKRIAREPERFGKGAIEGVMAPESADNAAEQTSFIPTLALGIPGSATMALMLGALMMHGIAPGPSLMTDQPTLFWGLVMSFWIGNVMLVLLNIPLNGIWVRLLAMPYHWLFPSIIVFISIGGFSVSSSTFDLWLVMFFGLLGYFARRFDFPITPMLLGFVMGPLMEEHFRRAMLISHGDFATFVQHPISASLISITLALLCWSAFSAYRAMASRKPAAVDA